MEASYNNNQRALKRCARRQACQRDAIPATPRSTHQRACGGVPFKINTPSRFTPSAGQARATQQCRAASVNLPGDQRHDVVSVFLCLFCRLFFFRSKQWLFFRFFVALLDLSHDDSLERPASMRYCPSIGRCRANSVTGKTLCPRQSQASPASRWGLPAPMGSSKAFRGRSRCAAIRRKAGASRQGCRSGVSHRLKRSRARPDAAALHFPAKPLAEAPATLSAALIALADRFA